MLVALNSTNFPRLLTGVAKLSSEPLVGQFNMVVKEFRGYNSYLINI